MLPIYNFIGTTLSSFGVALVDHETERLGKRSVAAYCPPRDSLSEQHAALQMAREVMLRLDSGTLIDKVSQPILWHTDLHMGNVFVSDTEPTKIVSLIDW